MRISAIIPTFNGEKYIEQTLESIFKQTRPVDEIIISDDLSTDQTVQKAKHISSSFAIPLRVVAGNGTGISNNYLNAMRESSGSILIVGDQDDCWHEHRVERIAEAFNNRPSCMLISSDSLIVDANMQAIGSTLRGGVAKSLRLSKLAESQGFRQFLLGLRFDAHTLAFRKSLVPLLETPAFNQAGFWFEEKVVVAALALGDYYYDPAAMTFYRQHENQHTAQVGRVSETQTSLFSPQQRKELLKSLLSSQVASSPNSEEVYRRLDLLEKYLEFSNNRLAHGGAQPSFTLLFQDIWARRYQQFTRRPVLSTIKDISKVLGFT